MRILDRYAVKQLVPVWIWVLFVSLFLACLVDLFGRLDEILRYHVPLRTILHFYANFTPIVFVKACPITLLISSAFVASRLARHQELLAMNASGTSLLRASVPFLFVGWVASLMVFAVNELIIPHAGAAYDALRQEAFRSDETAQVLENVAIVDVANRLYHARQLDVKKQELRDLTILEHDWHNQPFKSLRADRAIWTPHGWLLLYGTIYRIGPRGALQGNPEPFVERLYTYPVTPRSFTQAQSRPETMRYGQLRRLIRRLQNTQMANVRRYSVELVAKITFPLVNVVVCLIGFVGCTQPQLRGQLRGLGISLGWGLLYYLAVGAFQGIAKEWPLPIPIAMWTPHVAAVWWCMRKLKQTH